MLRKLLARLVVVSITVFVIVFAFNLGVAGRQEEAKRKPFGEQEEAKSTPSGEPIIEDSRSQEARRREIEIDRMLSRYDLKPHPAPAIPDNPPPHEGAMISSPHYTVEPPDLILVEVLETLPGRPISGERLVRPDGTISLGFYGNVFVKGLTLDQVKVTIIKHLRKYLNDAALGLEVQVLGEEPKPSKPALKKLPIPEPPKEEELFPDAKEKEKGKGKPRSSSYRSRPGSRPLKTRSASSRSDRRSVPVRAVGLPETSQEPPVSPAPTRIKIPVDGVGQITITIERGGQAGPVAEKTEPDLPPELDYEGTWQVVPPDQSGNVFVDITAYNSKYYFVQGDVLITGRLNCTGNETVLDALNFAGGLVMTAEPKDIHLVRPGPAGRPPKIYKVDLEAIQQKGEVATNYQIFAGDRLVVGRNEVVKKTMEIDRLNAPIQSLTATILQEASMLRSLQFATAADRNELLKEYVDFWAKELARPSGVKFDEQALREALIRKMNLPPNPSAPPPSSR